MTQPPIIKPASVEVAEAKKLTLSNGVDLYTLSSDDFEVLRVTFVFRAGSAVQDHFFTASSVTNLMAEGTKQMTAHEIAEQLDYYGSWFDVNTDRDNSYISFCTLTKFFRPTLDVAEQILLHPTFPEEEVTGYAAKRKQRLAIERTKVESKAREAFVKAMFGETHPYGVSAEEQEYDTLTRQHLVDFYTKRYTAENCFVVCSGKVGEEELQRIISIAEQLPQRGKTEERPFPAIETQREVFIHHEGAVQSAIRIGRVLFPREHPDFVGMQVVGTALGGYFGSRLMKNLREEHGYTYGVMSAMLNFEKEGYFAIGTQVGSDVTAEALQEIRNEVERLRHEEMSVEELDLVKNMMIGEVMRILDGPFGIADVTIENILCGTDNHAIDRNIRAVRDITPAQVRRLAEQYLAPEDLVTVVVGDQTAILGKE